MLVVFAYCRKDFPQTLNLLRWMSELDEVQTKHELLLVAAAELPDSMLKQVADAARLVFATVTTIKPVKSVEIGWPGACNHLFRTAALYISRAKKWPFFQWIEADCVPLVEGAFDQTEAAYLAAGKPFLGNTVHQPINHLPGNAVYPADIKRWNPWILQAVKHGRDEVAWDCIRPELTLKHTADTPLFQHVWVAMGTDHPQTFKDHKSLSILRKDAVFFHRNKDHTLIARLRERRAGVKDVPTLVERVKEWIKPDEKEKVIATKVVEIPASRSGETLLRPIAVSSAKPPIYTYFEKLFGFPDQSQLIELWKRLWSAQGWEPVVLGEKDAKKGRMYARLLNAIQKLPTCNHRGYENACYLRHLAMANRGGGFLTDYDVMPVDFRWAGDGGFGDPVCILEPTRVPCAIEAKTEGYAQIVQYFLDYRPSAVDLYQGKPHVSDMEILRKTNLPWANVCVEYLCSGKPLPNDPGDGWRQASMIHFSSASLDLRGKDATEKVKVIEEVLAELKESRQLQPV